MFRIVIDTNVLLDSARGSFSFPARIMQAVIDGTVQAFASHRMKREHDLIRNRLIRDPEVHEMIEDYLSHVQFVQPSVRIHAVKTDHEDDKFLEAAVEAQCDYIVTSDHDLLDMKTYDQVEMVTPGQFWTIYEEDKDPDGSSQWNSWISGFFSN